MQHAQGDISDFQRVLTMAARFREHGMYSQHEKPFPATTDLKTKHHYAPRGNVTPKVNPII